MKEVDFLLYLHYNIIIKKCPQMVDGFRMFYVNKNSVTIRLNRLASVNSYKFFNEDLALDK